MTGAVLVTGVNGFVGRHVAAEFASFGTPVVGIGRATGTIFGGPMIDYLSADLTREWPRIDEVSTVVHLAGLSAIGPSFADPQRYVEINGGIMNRMATWMQRYAPRARGIVVSSGAVYAAANRPLTEASALGASSPYAVSKILVENLARFYTTQGLDLVVARPFNHIGPHQGQGFIVPDLASQIGSGKRKISTGDLTTERDYTDVRDVAVAYRLLAYAEIQHHRLFNVCSGRTISGRKIFEAVVQACDSPRAKAVPDEKRMRPDDPARLVGDFGYLRSVTGWEPRIPPSESIRDYVEFRLRASS